MLRLVQITHETAIDNPQYVHQNMLNGVFNDELDYFVDMMNNLYVDVTIDNTREMFLCIGSGSTLRHTEASVVSVMLVTVSKQERQFCSWMVLDGVELGDELFYCKQDAMDACMSYRSAR
jgi:hypothetical protein